MIDYLVTTPWSNSYMPMISFVYVTCSSKDYTAGFGATPYEGSYTPQIHDAFNRLVYIRTCVCVCVLTHTQKPALCIHCT